MSDLNDSLDDLIVALSWIRRRRPRPTASRPAPAVSATLN